MTRWPAAALGATLVLALGGCGGAHRTAAGPGPGAGQPPDVHFTGGSIPGTVYLGAGPDEGSFDGYRLSGPLPHAHRVTYSPTGLGLQGLAADARDVVVDRICCGGLEFLERLNPAAAGGLPGTVLAPGTDPALAPDGRFAHVQSDYRGCGCDALLVRTSLLGADRVAYQVAHPRTIIDAVWSPQGRLAIMVGTSLKDGAIGHAVILVDPDSAHQRLIDPGSTWVLESGIWFGPRGELSYELTGRVVIQPATGPPRSFLLNDWHAGCWLQNGTILVVDSLAAALGRLDPTTGAITTIGHYGSSTTAVVLDCPARS